MNKINDETKVKEYENDLDYFFINFNKGKDENDKIDENNFVFINKSEIFNDNNNLINDKNNGTFKFRKKTDITFTYYDGLKEEYKSKIPDKITYMKNKKEFLDHLKSKGLDLNTIYIIKISSNQYKKIKEIEGMQEPDFINFIKNTSLLELKFKHECYDKCTYKVVFCHNPDLSFDIKDLKEVDSGTSEIKELVTCEFDCDPNGYKNISCTCETKKYIFCTCYNDIFYYTFGKLFEKQEIKRNGDNFEMTKNLNLNNFLTFASFISHHNSISYLLKDKYTNESIDFVKLYNEDYDYKIKNRENEKRKKSIKGKTEIQIMNTSNFEILHEHIFDTNVTIYVILNGNIEKKKYKTNIGTSDNKSISQEIEYFDMSKKNGSIFELMAYLTASKLIPKHSCEYYVDEKNKIRLISTALEKIFSGERKYEPYNKDTCGIFLKGCTSKELIEHINANSSYLNGLKIDNEAFEALRCICCLKHFACCCCCAKCCNCCKPFKEKEKDRQKNKNHVKTIDR